ESAALRALYDATGGDNWSPAVNWTSAPIAGWGSEVTILNNRVTQVNLQGSGLTGEVPGKIRDITSLETLDFGGNNLTGIPNLSQMPNLTSLDVTENRLEFDDLEPNVSVTGLSFANQQDIGVATVQEIPQGTDLTLDISVGGANNEYQWFFEDTPITAETATSYLIDSINFEDMGVYHVRATSPVMSALDPNFFLKGADQTVYAHADISFTPIYQDLDANDARLDEGEAVLLGITEPGQPYDSLPVISIGPEDIVFEDIRLGDYLFAIRTDSLFLRTLSDNRTDSVRLLPTYFESTPFWEEADVLALRTDIDDTIDMQQRPRPLPAIPDGGEVGLTLESDFAEETTGRAEARRRVRRAGCSLSKRRSSGRPEEDIYDLFAYKETDDQGRVTFENLPADRYRLNIQYPGIPMDSTSFVEFDVGDGGVENNTLELEALVTEAGIAVELIEELGFYRQYFKDLSVYPNPTSERLQVHYSKLMSDDVMMRLMDRSGKTILEEKVEKGLNQTFEVDVSDVIGGIYILNFYDLNSSNKSVVSFKIVVNH
ncbi:MAG: leucine-rich repeat domain-containing protein, partial [Cyclobacteriaceae bacterium]|nr:leucine-rich repeat domain-containing protein [Cyclobacteriaceae bacterium HetDA_MAG_MS6]